MICQGLSREQANELYLEILNSNDNEALIRLVKEDLFFLLTIGCKRKDINRDWLYERCREVEAAPDGYLDLWAREHYKSTIITFGKSIQDILKDPNVTIGIFSHTRPIAKAFLKQIKTEFEQNTFLKSLFSDVLYQEPQKEAKVWSLDEGIRVKRTENPKEETIQAWGLVDGQPTSKHYKIQIYDDVVTKESVTTPDQIKKTTDAWELSLDLGAQGGVRRYIGTRYHLYDTYSEMIKRGSVTPRIKPATDNGKMDGEPVFLTKEALAAKRRDQGPYTFSCQQLLDPVADKAMGFKEEWLSFYETLGDTAKWNKYLLVDPANQKKRTSDYTVMVVIGLAPDGNYYLLDGVRDRLNLTQRAQKLFELQRKHKPLAVAYERYGMQSDIEHVKYVMEQENYRFSLTEVGGQVPKEDRIQKLVPVFEQRRFYLSKRLSFVNHEGVVEDFVEKFKTDEYLAFPVCVHDDMLDCMARILDPVLGAKFPKPEAPKTQESRTYSSGGYSTGWMG